ncbi:hypothetical protein EDD99_3117 [Streptomyces sp. 846.5]|nr:hypothetical protein [Streptomyces sp. 846.5]TDU04644.1 hypothetical protein EDD99_3117 [Streptomyces sp. 846.5]
MIVLDHTAVRALREGHRVLLAFAATSPDDDGDRVCVPALSLLGAALEPGAPALADHIGALIGVDFAPLDFMAYVAVEALTAVGVPWQCAQAVHVVKSAGAGTDAEQGCVVISSTPEAYDGTGVMVADLGKL